MGMKAVLKKSNSTNKGILISCFKTKFMFIISLTYKAQLEKVDEFLDAHVSFLNKQYDLGNFLASGRKISRTGGIILSKVSTKSELEKILEEDPFKINNLADYEIIEFVPSKTCEELKFLTE